MSNQQKMMIVIALLALANIGRWYFSAEGEETVVAQEAITATAFVLYANHTQAGDITVMQRDLFQVKSRERGASAPNPKIRQHAETAKKIVPVEVEQAQSEISQIRLLGVVIRKGKAQAYLANGKETYLVFDRDTVANRFYVNKVSLDYIDMTDQKLDIRRTIPISGR